MRLTSEPPLHALRICVGDLSFRETVRAIGLTKIRRACAWQGRCGRGTFCTDPAERRSLAGRPAQCHERQETHRQRNAIGR